MLRLCDQYHVSYIISLEIIKKLFSAICVCVVWCLQLEPFSSWLYAKQNFCKWLKEAHLTLHVLVFEALNSVLEPMSGQCIVYTWLYKWRTFCGKSVYCYDYLIIGIDTLHTCIINCWLYGCIYILPAEVVGSRVYYHSYCLTLVLWTRHTDSSTSSYREV